MTNKFAQPQKIDRVTEAFPSGIGGMPDWAEGHLIPAYRDIPEEFKSHDKDNMWVRFFNEMFYRGIQNIQLVPKPGIDPEIAFRHIRAVSASYEPKHEHKEAAVAYLMSLWFEESSTWVPVERKPL